MELLLSPEIKKLQRLFLLINRESQLILKIKTILNQSLTQYQSLPLYQVLFSGKDFDEKFLKIGKTLFLLSYLSSHRNVLVSLAKLKLQKVEEDVNKSQIICEDGKKIVMEFEEQLKSVQNACLQQQIITSEKREDLLNCTYGDKQEGNKENSLIKSFILGQTPLINGIFPANFTKNQENVGEMDIDSSLQMFKKLFCESNDVQTLDAIKKCLLNPEMFENNQNINFQHENITKVEMLKYLRKSVLLQKEDEIKKEDESVNNDKSTAIDDNRDAEIKTGFKRRNGVGEDKLRKKLCVKE